MNRLRAFLRFLSAAAVLLLIGLFCWQCIDIYVTGARNDAITGNSIFSMSIVTDRLETWLPLIWLCLVVIVMAIILHIPFKDDAPAPASTPEYRLRQLKLRLSSLPDAAKKEESRRRVLYAGFGILVFLLLLPALCYVLDINHFKDWDLESVLAEMILHTLPWCLFAALAWALTIHLITKSIEREILALRAGPKSDELPSSKLSTQHPVKIRFMLFTAALLFILLGIMNGGLYDVLVKAINICTECIGLG